MQPKALTKRSETVNLQFKLLSAIGIILVVSGHCYHGGISLAYEWFPTYSFQLSLFVFISGYFYLPQNEDRAFRYIWRRFRRLIIPAYLWNIAYGLFILMMKRLDYSIGAEVTPYNLFLMPLIDGEAFQYNLGSWFVYPLFLVCVGNVLFRKLTSLLKVRNEYFFLIIYLLVGIYGVGLSLDGHNAGVMKLVTRAMFFLPCFQFGRLYRSRWESLDTLDNTAYFAVLFGVQLLLITSCNDLQYFPSGMSGFQNGAVIPYITSLTGIAFWLRIARLITPVIRNWRGVRLIGDNTYSIMLHHMLGFMLVKWLFYLLSSTTGQFLDFDPWRMRSSIWYYYLPKGHEQFALLYLAAGLFLPIAVHMLGEVYCRMGLSVWGRLHKNNRKPCPSEKTCLTKSLTKK